MKKSLTARTGVKPVWAALAGAVTLLLLGGCTAADSSAPIGADTPGVWNHYFVYPFSYLIIYFANLFRGDYGLSLIFIR